MADKTKLSRPPRPADDSEAFIAGADYSEADKPVSGQYPWNDPSVRSDVIKSFNIRLSEPYKVRLQWLAERLPRSQHQIAVNAIETEIDRLIEELTQ